MKKLTGSTSLTTLSALLSGLLFGIGLVLSGMTKASKVLGFLDFAGDWDPSLAFVMGGAVSTHFLLLQLIKKREAPLLEPHFHPPATTVIDRRLIVGSAIFGVGWGMGGFCPGPAVVSAAGLNWSVLTLVAAMFFGSMIARSFGAKGKSAAQNA